jgi:zinc transporter ZupT
MEHPMADSTAPSPKRITLKTIGLLLLPIVLLAGVIALFLSQGGLQLERAAPVETLSIDRYTLRRGNIDLHVRNTGPEPLMIAQVIINDAVWPFTVKPSPELDRLEQATISLAYPWAHAEAYSITIFTGSSIPFTVDIPVAFETPRPSSSMFWTFALIGLYVGVIPVFLGIFWFPALRQLGRKWMMFLMAITAGLLLFLGFDTVAEGLEMAGKVAGPMQGIGLLGIGAVGTFLLLDSISRKQLLARKSETNQRLAVAFMIAAGIGFHNLGEGLAIGAAYNVGEIALGTFLVVGFIIQNITEGLGIIAPLLREKPRLGQLALLGLMGGAPAVLGAWIGGFAPSPVLAVLFFGIGAGAIFEVVYEISKLIQKDTSREPMPFVIFSGVLAGMLLLWVTGLWIK